MGVMLFLVKKCWALSALWVEITHHDMGKHVERVFKKKFTEAECSLSQQWQLAHWCRWVPGTRNTGGNLDCKRPTLQNVILGLFGRSSLIYVIMYVCLYLLILFLFLRNSLCVNWPLFLSTSFYIALKLYVYVIYLFISFCCLFGEFFTLIDHPVHWHFFHCIISFCSFSNILVCITHILLDIYMNYCSCFDFCISSIVILRIFIVENIFINIFQ